MSSNKKIENSEPKDDIVTAEPVKPKKRKLKNAAEAEAESANAVTAPEAEVAAAPKKKGGRKKGSSTDSDNKPDEIKAEAVGEQLSEKKPKRTRAKKTENGSEGDANDKAPANGNPTDERVADSEKPASGTGFVNSNEVSKPASGNDNSNKNEAQEQPADEKADAAKPASIKMDKIIAEEKEKEQEISDRLDRIASASPFAKYDAIYTQAEEEEDRLEEEGADVKPVVSVSAPPIEKNAAMKNPRNRRRHEDRAEFFIDDDSASISTLTKGNVWDVDVDGIYKMLLEGRRTIHWAENKTKYMNIIRPVFDIEFINKSNQKLVASLEESKFKIFSYPASADDTVNAIAIRKHEIKKITDLTMENIWHLSPADVLDLIRRNLGTGWKGLPLPIKDIIESAFYVDSSTLPQAAMHRKGGIIDRRKASGYEALEIARGTWIEAIFLKEKPKVEKEHFASSLSSHSKTDRDDDDDSDNDDDELDEDIDTNDDVDDEDEDISLDEATPQIEDFDDIAEAEDVDDDGVDDE